MKKVLGLGREAELPLNRVEPVRSAKVLYNAGYTEWADYASNCRTAPSRWANEHPALPPPRADDAHKYPWG